ncbi:hypothetical protein BJ742DRAFT_734554 [Cladochytrium replicatum]|nr:hypothetical protein BJ742DRAFT_734554 [Cladochytrium replicatum]
MIMLRTSTFAPPIVIPCHIFGLGTEVTAPALPHATLLNYIMPALILSSMKNHGFKLLFQKRRSNECSSRIIPASPWPPPPTGYAEPQDFLPTGVSARLEGERILVLPGGHRMVQPTVVSPGGAVHSILEPVAASISGDGVDASIAALRAAASGFPKRRLAHISGSTFDIDGKGSEIMPGYHESPVSSTAAQPPMTPQQQISSIPQMHNLEGEQLGGLHPRPRPSPSGARVFLPSPMRRQLDADFPKSSLPIALDIAGVQLHSDPLNTRVNSSLPREDFGVSSGNLSDPGPYPGTSTETVRPTALQRSGTYGSIRNRFFDEPPHQKRPNTSSHCRHQLNIVFPTDPERRMHDSPAPVSFDALHHSFPGSLPEYLIATGAADVEMRRNASVRSMVTTVSILSTPAGLFRGLKYLTKRSPRPNVRESMSSKRSSVATTKFPRSRGNSICGSVVSAAAAAALLAYADASGESNRNSLAEYATDAVNDFTIARAWLQQNPSLSNSLPRSRRCNELIEASLQRRLANGSMTTISVNEELLVEPRRKKRDLDDKPRFSPFNDKKDAEARSIWAPSDTELESDVPTKSPEIAFANFAARQRSINISGPGFESNNQRVRRMIWQGSAIEDELRSWYRIARTTSGMRSKTGVHMQDERGRFCPLPFSDQRETHTFKTSTAAIESFGMLSTPRWEELHPIFRVEPQIEVISGEKEDAKLEDDDWIDLDDTDSIISEPKNRAKPAMSHRERPAEVPGLPLFSSDQSTYPFKSLSRQNSAMLSPLAATDQQVPELSTSPTSVPNSVPSLSGLSAGTHYKTDPIYASMGSPSTSAGTYDGRLNNTPSTSYQNFYRPSFSSSPLQKELHLYASVNRGSEDDQFLTAPPINMEITTSVLKRVAAASAVIRASEMAGNEKESLTTAARELLNISNALKNSQSPELANQPLGTPAQSPTQFPPSRLSMKVDAPNSNPYSSLGGYGGAGPSGTSYDSFNSSVMRSSTPLTSQFQQSVGVPTSAELYGLNFFAMMGFGLIGNSGSNRIARAATAPPTGLLEEDKGVSKSESHQLHSDDPILQNLPPGTNLEQVFCAVEKLGASDSAGYSAGPSKSTLIPPRPCYIVIMIQVCLDHVY